MRALRLLALVALTLASAACRGDRMPPTRASAIVGAWRSKVEIRSGAFASMKDLEFLYAFQAGGTMTESSNYDAAPPVPPAYGVWRQSGENRFEVRYEFFTTRAATPEEAAGASGGWLPSGRGVFDETIQVSEDGGTFTSSLRYELFDPAGKPVDGGGSGEGRGRRLRPPGS